MNKKSSIVYIVSFFIICTVPVLLMPFVKNDESVENRKLSSMPSIVSENSGINLNWASEYETYLSEHFAFREKLVTADSLIKSAVFRTSSNEKVICGKNGWLYLSETADDYTAENTMSARRINNTAKTLSLVQEYVQNKGSRFIFMAAPNKNTVYPENMPSRYIKTGNNSNLEMLSEKLDEYSVNQLDLVSLFKSQDSVLYHTRDSHWTNEGAVLVYNALMDRFGIEHDDLSSVYKHSEMIWHGDLDRMLFPSLEKLSEQIVYDMDFSFDYTYNFRSEDDYLISAKNSNGTENVLMYRDSFGRSLYPFIAENSTESVFSREIPYRLDLLDNMDTDITILEIVERNLENITEKAPFMPAPARNLDISAAVEPSSENSCFISEKNGLVKIYGRLDEKYFSDNSDIYITLENENSVLCFEAFPIYESELLNDENQSDYGYSLYIDPSVINSGQYSINAYISNENRFICTDTLENIKF